jgi:hypothetical protein
MEPTCGSTNRYSNDCVMFRTTGLIPVGDVVN